MTAKQWFRQAHRWVSILFTLVSAAIFIAPSVGRKRAQWIYYPPLFPLALLVLSGLCMFFRPYLAQVRGTQPARSATVRS